LLPDHVSSSNQRPRQSNSDTNRDGTTLREMERDGLIDRKVYPVVPPMVEYSLTPMGRLFVEPIEMLYAWAAKNDEALSKLRRRRKKRTASRDKARKTQ
jgi:DNA-binding PadR family transcriptional regulator